MKVYKKVYKAVKQTDNPEVFASCYVPYYNDFCCLYRLRGKTVPVEGTKLFAFDTLKHARRFVREHDPYFTILECSVYGYTPGNRMSYFTTEGSIRQFWKSTALPKACWTPPGTLMCNSLTPIKVVS